MRKTPLTLRAERFHISLEICGWLNISQSHLTKLNQDGVLPFARNEDGDAVKGRYHLKETVQTYIKYVLQRVKDKPVSHDELERMKSEKLKIGVQSARLDLELKKGTIVRWVDVEKVATDMLIAVRTHLLGYPAQVGPFVLGKEDQDEVVKILSKFMHEALSDLQIPNHQAVVYRNRKMQKYTDQLTEPKENGEEEL